MSWGPEKAHPFHLLLLSHLFFLANIKSPNSRQKWLKVKQYADISPVNGT
jgi:hypothetical protein